MVIGDSDFVTNSLLGVQGNRDLFLNTLNWLSQQENLISIRPKDPDDRRITLTADQQRWVKFLALLDPAGRDLRRRHLQLDAEARMRSFRSIAVLGVLLVGLVAYLYFVDSKKPVDQAEEKAKVFAGLEADKIEEVKIDTVAGDTTVAQKAADGWKLVSPTPARADDSELSSITSNLASVTIERVVDEAPKNLGDYGLKEPVVQVSFKTKGAKNFRTLDLGTKTPTGSDMYARVDGDEEGVSRSELPGLDVQPQAVRSPRQEGPELRSRQGRSRRDCRRRQAG